MTDGFLGEDFDLLACRGAQDGRPTDGHLPHLLSEAAFVGPELYDVADLERLVQSDSHMEGVLHIHHAPHSDPTVVGTLVAHHRITSLAYQIRRREPPGERFFQYRDFRVEHLETLGIGDRAVESLAVDRRH